MDTVSRCNRRVCFQTNCLNVLQQNVWNCIASNTYCKRKVRHFFRIDFYTDIVYDVINTNTEDGWWRNGGWILIDNLNVKCSNLSVSAEFVSGVLLNWVLNLFHLFFNIFLKSIFIFFNYFEFFYCKKWIFLLCKIIWSHHLCCN